MFVTELYPCQLKELKERWFIEYIYELEDRYASDEELAIVDGYISDDALMEKYRQKVFTNNDFDCTSGIPSVSSIREQFDAINCIMQDVKTVEDARRIEKKLGLYIEIGPKDGDAEHCTWGGFDNLLPEEIEWFRVEAWENLGYIYFRTDTIPTYFDVYDADDTIIDSTKLDNLEQDYDDFMKSIA